jgi:Leucine-rich repeat (LRR) protein
MNEMKFRLRYGVVLAWMLLGLGCGDGGKGSLGEADGEDASSRPDTVAFADAGLEAVVRAALERPEGGLTKEELLVLEELDASDREIVDLSGIEWLEDLQVLVLKDNRIVDLSPLAELDLLKFLDLDNNRIVDLSALAGLERLEGVILDNNGITDLSPLLELERLKSAAVENNPVTAESLAAFEGVFGEGERIVPPEGSIPNLPADSRIAFVARWRNTTGLYVAQVDGENPINLSEDFIFDLVWSPDGTAIAFAASVNSNTDIYVIYGEDYRQVRLTEHRRPDTHPVWSPDGEWIAFSSDRDGDNEIYVMRVDGTDVRQLTDNEERDIDPAWSPDGTLIAFTAGEGSESYGIYAISAAGGQPVEMVNFSGSESNPSWAPAEIIGFEPVIEPAFFADEALQRAVRQAVGKSSIQPLNEEDLLGIEKLKVQNAGITDLNGMERLQALEELDLGNWSIIREVNGQWMIDSSNTDTEQWNRIRDLSPLAGLVGLEELNLGQNPVRDISPLAKLANLTHLSLEFVVTDDVSPLSGLTRLTHLSLNSEYIDDISPLAPLVGLEQLLLENCRIEDLAPLEDMDQLVELTVNGTEVWDLAPLAELEKVKALILINNLIDDVTPLAGMSGLVRLDLTCNEITDIAPLLELEKVTSIDLKGNPLDEVARKVDIPALRNRGVRVTF